MKHLIAITFFGLVSFTSQAQYRSVLNSVASPGGPGISNGNSIGFTIDVNSPTPTVPFDGGLSFLLLGSGIAYVGKKQKMLKSSEIC